MQKVYRSVAEEGATTPEEMAEITGGKHSTVRTYARRLAKMQLLQRDSHGKYGVADQTKREDGPQDLVFQPDPDALRNAGVIVRYADTGHVWFAIRFPEHMPVLNPHVIDVENPSANNTKPEPLKKGAETNG